MQDSGGWMQRGAGGQVTRGSWPGQCSWAALQQEPREALHLLGDSYPLSQSAQ